MLSKYIDTSSTRLRCSGMSSYAELSNSCMGMIARSQSSLLPQGTRRQVLTFAQVYTRKVGRDDSSCTPDVQRNCIFQGFIASWSIRQLETSLPELNVTFRICPPARVHCTCQNQTSNSISRADKHQGGENPLTPDLAVTCMPMSQGSR